MTTYTELLLRQYVTCSCCGKKTQPSGAAVSTRGETVTWIQCPQCEDACTKWRHAMDKRLWGKTCGIEPCRWEEDRAKKAEHNVLDLR